jgi:hypothetical protein
MLVSVLPVDSVGSVDISLAAGVGVWLEPVSRLENEHEVRVSAIAMAHKALREDMFTA